MKYILNIIFILFFTVFLWGCTDEPLIEDNGSEKPFFNIEEFSDGYSIAFDVSLDRFGGANSRDENDEAQIIEWENYLDPEEFRVLFFDQNDQFLFESRSRWFTKVTSTSTADKWRVGVPLFPYLSDGFDENNSDNDDSALEEGYNYNWDGIIEIMRTQSFKIAILANRPTKVRVPSLSDLDPTKMKLKNFGKNGPFWSSLNSIATEDRKGKEVKKVFDLHHCQYDPIYENKNKDGNAYSFLFDYGDETMDDGSIANVPLMGAVSSWLHGAKIRKITKYNTSLQATSDTEDKRYYRLPVEQDLDANESGLNIRYAYLNTEGKEEAPEKLPEDSQYIPMYGIQEFNPIANWVKGTTFNLSQQVGSQTGDRIYTPITLLRSVVKLELRIPMKDSDGDEIDVDNTWAQIWENNYMARCEPMDVSTSTNSIWKDNHTASDWLDPSEVCEWTRIRDFGPLVDNANKNLNIREKLGWFYGCWQDENMGWDFGSISVPAEGTTFGNFKAGDYPRIFNPITQRLKSALITDCKKDINGQYYRWIIYCGERNINDPNTVTDSQEQTAYVNFFRIRIKRKVDGSDKWYIYDIPITDYTEADNPAFSYLKELGSADESTSLERIKDMYNVPSNMNTYFGDIAKTKNVKHLPFPLLRNHFYRVNVTFGNGDDIDVQVMDAETRIVSGIVFD